MHRLLPASPGERRFGLAVLGLLLALILATGISDGPSRLSWTLVDASGAVHSDWTTGTRVTSSRVGTGLYEVVSAAQMRACSQHVIVGSSEGSAGAAEVGGSALIQVTDLGEGRLRLQTYDADGMPADRSFGIALRCDR